MDATNQGKLIWGRSADGYVVRVDGRGTARESPVLRELGISCLDGDVDTRLTIDLSECDYLDSTFLGCLVALQKHGTAVGQDRFVIAAPAERRNALLSATAFDKFFNQVDAAPASVAKPLTITPDRVDGRGLGRHIMECHRELAQVKGPQQQAFAKISERLAKELDEGQPDAKTVE